MEWIVWDDSLETGLAELDEDHRKLMELINRLADGVTNHRGMAFIMAVFDEFIEHAQRHFAMEERLMAHHDYPKAKHHAAHHAALLEELTDSIEAITPDSAPSVALLDFLEAWLKHHILSLDKEMACAISRSA